MQFPAPLSAVALALDCVDLPDTAAAATLPGLGQQFIDAILGSTRNNSDKVALLFLLAYKSGVPSWNIGKLPQGWRPADKHLAGGLTVRALTLHGNVTSPGENMGSKGNAAGFDLFKRPRLGDALSYFQSNPHHVLAGLHYVAARFKASYRPPVTIKAPASGALVYTRALVIAHRLLHAESGGHFPQFLVAALLRALHESLGTGLRVSTQHPNAADEVSKAAGDVELVATDNKVVDAFEVTVRPDWKNRRQDLLTKMRKAGLSRYNLLCIIDPDDPDIGDVSTRHAYMQELGGYDIAVVDIREFVAVVLQQLPLQGRKAVLTYLEEYIKDPKLSGIPNLIDALKAIIEEPTP